MDLGERPLTAQPLQQKKIEEKQTDIMARPKSAENNKVYHCVPRYDVYGQELPKGRGSGLRPFQRPSIVDIPNKLPGGWICNDVTQNEPPKKQEAHQLLGGIDWEMVERLSSSKAMERILSNGAENNTRRIGQYEHTRSKLLERRKRERVHELSTTRNKYESYFDIQVKGLYKEIEPNSLHRPATADPILNVSKSEPVLSKRDSTFTRPKTATQNPSCFRKNYPSLQWVDNPTFKTKTELLNARKKEHQYHSIQNLKNVAYKQPRSKTGFLEQENRTHRTRTKMLQQRSQNLRKSLEASRQKIEAKRKQDTMEYLGFDVYGDSIWEDQNDDVQTVPESEEPVVRVKKAIRRRKTSIAGNIAKRNAQEVSQNFDTRQATTRFTDAILELQLENLSIGLDEKGKCKKVKPCETDPMYSSFTPDHIFMDPIKRKRLNNLIEKRKNRIPFARLSAVSASTKKLRKSSNSGPVSEKPSMEYQRTTKRVGLDNRRTTAIICEPKRAGLMVQKQEFRRPTTAEVLALGLDAGVRTGGFQFLHQHTIEKSFDSFGKESLITQSGIESSGSDDKPHASQNNNVCL